MIAKKALTALGVVVFGAGLMVSPVQAKCVRACRQSLHSTFVSCKGACAPKKAGKACRATCRSDSVAARKKCNKATPPACSASGAFIESSVD